MPLLYVPSILTLKFLPYYITCFQQPDAPPLHYAIKTETTAAASVPTTATVKWNCYRITLPCLRHKGTLRGEGFRVVQQPKARGKVILKWKEKAEHIFIESNKRNSINNLDFLLNFIISVSVCLFGYSSRAQEIWLFHRTDTKHP